MSTDDRHTETGSDKLGALAELQLESAEDARWLESEARRIGVSKKQLVEQAVMEMIASRPPGSTLPIPREIVSQAVRDFVSRQKGQRSPDK
jgi:hypothetical protein